MGHRANYALIEGGKQELYFYNWGGLSVASDIFFGPEITKAFIRSLIPVETLLTEIWCEGGVLLDFDAQRLFYFGWNGIDNPVSVAHFNAILALTYPGWEIRYAAAEIKDICRYLGRDLSEVEEAIELDEEDITPPPTPPWPTDEAAIDELEETMLSAQKESLDLQRWTSGLPGKLFPHAALFSRPDTHQAFHEQYVREVFARYRAQRA